VFWLGVEIGGAREVFLDPEIESRFVSQTTREGGGCTSRSNSSGPASGSKR